MNLRYCSVLCILMFASLVSLQAQEKEKKVYRVSHADESLLRRVEQLGAEVVEEEVRGGLVIMATPTVENRLRSQGYSVDYLADQLSGLYPTGPQLKSTFFRNTVQTNQELAALAAAHPDITHLDTIGFSLGNRPICCLKISDNPLIDEDEPPVLIAGTHHGNEVHAIEAVFYQINYLLSNYGTDPEVTAWIHSLELWFVPLVNPDGREAMRRTNDHGVDLNRNYSFGFEPGGNHGAAAFSEPETRAIRDLAAKYPPIMSLTYHTSGQYFLYSWTHTDQAAPDSAAMIYLGTRLSEAVTYLNGNRTEHYTLRQGGRWYFTAGEYCDYMYVTHNTLAFTVEMGTSQAPDYSVIPAMVESNLQGFKTLLRHINKAGVTGIVTDALTGKPVRASVEVTSINNQGKVGPRPADSLYGRYYRYLEPGTYPFRFTAEGYQPHEATITITEDSLIHYPVALMSEEVLRVTEVNVADGRTPITSGNADGKINIGETLGLTVTLANARRDASVNPRVTVTADNPFVTVLTGELTFGDIPTGAVRSSADTALFRVDPDCRDGEKVRFRLNITDDSGFAWSELREFEVYAPHVSLAAIQILNAGENGTIDAGEAVEIGIKIKNSGRQGIQSVTGSLSTGDGMFTVLTGQAEADLLLPGEERVLPFGIALAAQAPKGTIQPFELELTSLEGYGALLPFRLHNIRGLYDDFELGAGDWKHDSYGITSNAQDDWQLGEPASLAGDPAEAFSGRNCWGNDLGRDSIGDKPADGFYDPNVYSYLQSPPVDCSEMKNTGLIFSRWLTTKLNDVARISVNDREIWKSPEAGVTDTGWSRQVFDISSIADGNPSVVVTFELMTNRAAQAGGWNLDDLMIGHELASGLTSTQPGDILNGTVRLTAYPSPFTDRLNIGINLTADGPLKVEIWDLTGRRVKILHDGPMARGTHTLTWDGTQDSGEPVSPGTYLLRCHTATQTQTLNVLRQ